LSNNGERVHHTHKMSPTVAPNKYYHQELVMTTEVSPTGIEAFDSHFNFYNASRSTCTNITTTEDDGNIEDGVTKSSDTTSSNHHLSSPHNIKSHSPITSPLFEQASIQIQVAAAEFIEEPTTEHWERLVHLFCVERLLGQKHQQPPLEEEGQCDVMDDDGTVMQTEVVVVAAKKDLVHVVTNVSNSVGCNDDEHDDSFCTAHENEEELNEDSFRTANESEEESSVGYEHEDSFRTANENEEESSDEEEEDIVAVEPPVDNDDEEDDEHAMIIKAAQSIHLEGSTSRKALVSNPWMDAFRLAYQLL